MARDEQTAVEPFTDAETRYHVLVDERHQGRLDPRSFRSAVRALLVHDGEGREWVLGPEDGNWYRRDHGRWLLSEPPRRLVCAHCGHHNLTRHAFCVECGVMLRS